MTFQNNLKVYLDCQSSLLVIENSNNLKELVFKIKGGGGGGDSILCIICKTFLLFNFES